MTRLVDQAYVAAAASGYERLAFCVAFSLLEYALKDCIDVLSSRGDRASANWNKFAERQERLETLPDPDLQAAIEYLLSEPPEVQYAVKGRAEYRRAGLPGEGNAAICEALKRIRNNLFHGGKQPYAERDRRLVDAGLQIIEGYLALHRDLRSAFERGMD